MFVISLLLLVATPKLGHILVPPYVQLGPISGRVEVLWHSDSPAPAQLLYRAGQPDFRPAPIARTTKVTLGKVPTHYVQHASLPGLPAGARVEYRVGDYRGTFIAPKSPGQSFSFIAVGDIGRGTPGQRRLAPQMLAQQPDFAVLLGDIAYPYGRVSDYRKYFFPIQNSDTTSPKEGASLLRNTLSVGVTGNHDTTFRNLKRYPDGLAYYAYWSAPLNGPKMPLKINGSAAAISALQTAAGGNLERLGNFTFTYGNSRWVVIDANSYVNWHDPKLRQWLEIELQRSQGATWSFLAMHEPAYHSSRQHASDTQIRSIADLISKYKVDVVFAGHIHNYERSKPIQTINGKAIIDQIFDGRSHTKAKGTIHIVSGAGGAELYDPKQTDKPSTWQPYTAQFKSVYSFTKVDVNGRSLILRQINTDGKTIDEMRLTK
jgi:hypothetical protein